MLLNFRSYRLNDIRASCLIAYIQSRLTDERVLVRYHCQRRIVSDLVINPRSLKPTPILQLQGPRAALLILLPQTPVGPAIVELHRSASLHAPVMRRSLVYVPVVIPSDALTMHFVPMELALVVVFERGLEQTVSFAGRIRKLAGIFPATGLLVDIDKVPFGDEVTHWSDETSLSRAACVSIPMGTTV